MSQLEEELVKCGRNNNHMSTQLGQNWESTTTAGTLTGLFLESGATPLTQTSSGSTALFHNVMQHTTVKKAIQYKTINNTKYWGQHIQER